MSPITLRVTLAAVFAYASIYHGLLYRGRAREQEHLWFAMVSAGFGVLALANAMLLGSETHEAATLATQIAGAAAVVIMGSFYEYSSVVLGLGPGQRKLRLTWYLAGLLLLAFGAFVSPFPVPAVIDLQGTITPYPRAYVTVPGQVYFTLTLWLALHGFSRLVRAARIHHELVRVAVAWSATWLVASHDVATRVLGARSFMLSELLGVATIGAMTAAVLDRFVTSESDLQHRTEELHRSHRELQGIQEQLVQRQQLAAVGELSAVIAHEVRNPIAVIKNAVSGLRRERTVDEDRLTLLGILDEETDRLNRLMHDLLAYARPVAPQSQSVDLGALLEQAVEAARASVDVKARFEVATDMDAKARQVQGDPKLLLQALASLVENAVQAMPDGGTLRLETRSVQLRGQPAVEVHVVDTGHGMDVDVSGRAKEPFFTTRPRGTGLGLAIADRVAANHGGLLRIESEKDKGTCVTLVLPAERASAIPLPPGDRRRSNPGEAPG